VTPRLLSKLSIRCMNYTCGFKVRPSDMVKGPLRPVVQAAFASLVMYFEERLHAGEMRPVQIKLKDAAVKAQAACAANVETTLMMWGAAVRRKFDVENISLTAKVGRCNLKRVEPNIPLAWYHLFVLKCDDLL
jgi:hypothetical protein